MFHAFTLAFIARAVDHHRGVFDDRSQNRNFEKFLLCQRPDLVWYSKTNSGNVEIGGVIAQIDVCLIGADVFSTIYLVGNVVQFTKSPCPELQKKVAYVSESFTQQER